MSLVAALLIAALLLVGLVFLRQRPIALVLLVAAALVPLLLGAPSAALLTTTLVLSVVLAQPLYVVLGAVTLVCFQYLSQAPPYSYSIYPEKIFELTDKNVLLAIPFFVFSGAIMTHGSIARKLIAFAEALTYWLPGGLAIAAIGGCVMFAAISGSSPVTVIAIGGLMYPALLDAKHDERSSMGLLTSAGSLGIVIPPSIPMIIYAIVVSGTTPVDVGDLFLAGLGPGLVIGCLLAAYVITTHLRKSHDKKADLLRMAKGLAVIVAPLVAGELLVPLVGAWGHLFGLFALATIAVAVAWRQFVDGFWALLLPVLILGGIYSGFFTPTEAAAVAVVYAIIVEVFIAREMAWRDLPRLAVDSAGMMGSLIVIMVIAFVFNDYLVEAQIPERAVGLLAELHLSHVGFLLGLNVLLLIVGCFMDILSAILIVAPLVIPMAMAPGLEINPIHLGIIFIVNLEVGYLTPPVGLNLFVSSTLFKRPLGEIIRAVAPYTAVLLVGLLLITYLPGIALAPGQWLAELTSKPQPVAESPNEPAPGKVLSIEQLMKQAQQKQANEHPARVLSIQELMQQAAEHEKADGDKK